MPNRRAERARKTRKGNNKADTESPPQEIQETCVTRNSRSVGLKDGVHSTLRPCDEAEAPGVHYVEHQNTDPALNMSETEKKCLQSSAALQMYQEDSELSNVMLSGNLQPALSSADLVTSSSNGKLVMGCIQSVAGSLFHHVSLEDFSMDVSHNIMIKRDHSNTVEDVNVDASYNIMKKKDESNVTEDMNSDESYNITMKQCESNTTSNMNDDVSCNIKNREESNTVEDGDEKYNDDFQNQSDSCSELQQDNVCEEKRQQEQASAENRMPFSGTTDINGANTAAVHRKILPNGEDIWTDSNPQAITTLVTFNRLKSFSQSIVLQRKYDKSPKNTTTKNIEDNTAVFLSQTQQSNLDALGGSVESSASQALSKSRFLKRKVDKHLFSSQPQSKRFKPPSTATTFDHCYNTTDSVFNQCKDLQTYHDSQEEGICDNVVVVDAEAVHRNMDMLPHSTARIQGKSSAGYVMENKEDAFSVADDTEGSKILEENHQAVTQFSLPDCANVNEELGVSNCQDNNTVHEEFSFLYLPDCARVNEELILQLPDHAKVQEKLCLVTKSEISEQEKAVWLEDHVKEHVPPPESRSELQQNLSAAEDNKDSQTLALSSSLQVLPAFKFDHLDTDMDVNNTDMDVNNTDMDVNNTDMDVNNTDMDVNNTDMDVNNTDMSKFINTSLTNMECNKKFNQNSLVSTGEENPVKGSDSGQGLTCIETSSFADSTRCNTDVPDYPAETTVPTNVQSSTSVDVLLNDMTAGFDNSVLKHQSQEKLTLATTHEFVKNTAVCNTSVYLGDHLDSFQNEEGHQACTRELTINDHIINNFTSRERIENFPLTNGSVITSSMMTALTKERILSKDSINKACLTLACKIDPPLFSCSKMKEEGDHETVNQNQKLRSDCLKKELASDDDKSVDVGNLTKKCNTVNKITNSDTVKTCGEMLLVKASEFDTQAVSNPNEQKLCNKNRVTLKSCLHTVATAAHVLQDVFDSTNSHPLLPHAQTVCNKFQQQRPESDDQLIENTNLECGSLIAENFRNQMCSQQPVVMINNDSGKECSTSNKFGSVPISSFHNTDNREVQLKGHNEFNQKYRMEFPVTNKDTDQPNEDQQLASSGSFGGVSKYADVFPDIPITLTGPDSSILKNEITLDNTHFNKNVRCINATSDSGSKANPSLLTPIKTDLNANKCTSEQRTKCSCSTGERDQGNCQEVFDNLDSNSLSDLQETSGMPSNPISNDHKDSKITVTESLSGHKGTSSQPSDCPDSVSQGIFFAAQKNPQSDHKDSASAFLNKTVSGVNKMQKTLQTLSAMDSATYLSDSQMQQLASEDFEQVFNANEMEDIDKMEETHQDKFVHSFSSAQARSVREVEQRRAAGKKLIEGVIADLVSVNRQLLRMKREMETVKRVVQQQNKPRQSFHGKHEFGFRYQN